MTWRFWRLGLVDPPRKRYVSLVREVPIEDEIDLVFAQVLYGKSTRTVVVEQWRRIAGRLYWREFWPLVAPTHLPAPGPTAQHPTQHHHQGLRHHVSQ